MKIPSRHPSAARFSGHGSALVMTLIILVLISIMVLGFAAIVRSESPASASHEERMRAALFSQMGGDIVTGILRKETADPANPERAWTSRPGALIVDSGTNDQLSTQINLHSGVPSGYDPAASATWSSPAELNIPTFGAQGSHLLTDRISGGAPIRLPIRWIYVRKDGSLDSSEQPGASDTQNPLVGRFAFWTDDESSKLNLNTAWKRNSSGGGVVNPFFPSHPSSVSLSAIPGFSETMADQLHAFITPAYDYSDAAPDVRFLNSVNEARGLDRLHGTTAFSPTLDDARFDLTTFNHSPDTTFFNEPRIVLTTQERYAPKDAEGKLLKDAAGVPYFLDILVDSRKNQDPGTLLIPGTSSANIDPAKLNATIKKLISYLSRTDWPMVNGSSSFQGKYYGNDTDSLAQLALNIIEYVRSAESSATLVEPIRGIMTGANFVLDGGSGSNKSLMGVTRNLFLTEIGVWIKETPEESGPNAGHYQVKFLFEVHLPGNFGLSKVDLTNVDGKGLYFYITPLSAWSTTDAYYDGSGTRMNSADRLFLLEAAEILGGTNVNGGELGAGGYAKIVFTAYRAASQRPAELGSLRSGFGLLPTTTKYRNNEGKRLEMVPNGEQFPNFPVDAPTANEDQVTTWQVDDPSLNKNRNDWMGNGRISATLGLPPDASIRALGKTSSTVPRQDVDENGNITDIGARMPAPKGSAGNPSGVVYSPGELGFVHTGAQPNNWSGSRGVPWRTLRLQPEGDPSVVPDWAFMDLFTVSTEVPENAAGMFTPRPFAAAGRVNLNSRIEPYGNDSAGRPANTAAVERLTPLVAALLNIQKNDAGDRLTATEAETIAANIYSHRLAGEGANYGASGIPIYDSPGEVVEIEGVADQGEASEAIIRGLANLVTTRGSVFTVYTVGQALKQTPDGKIVVTAEQRLQIEIERYLDGGLTKLRKINSRNLTP